MRPEYEKLLNIRKTRQHDLPEKRWFRLDNAAKIYPAIMRSRHSSVFRLAALMHEQVDPEKLQKALYLVMPRFPQFAVRLRRGMFWYYLETCNKPALIGEDVNNPLRPWSRMDAKSYLFRVRYGDRRIAVEFFPCPDRWLWRFCFSQNTDCHLLVFVGHCLPGWRRDIGHQRTPPPKQRWKMPISGSPTSR